MLLCTQSALVLPYKVELCIVALVFVLLEIDAAATTSGKVEEEEEKNQKKIDTKFRNFIDRVSSSGKSVNGGPHVLLASLLSPRHIPKRMHFKQENEIVRWSGTLL